MIFYFLQTHLDLEPNTARTAHTGSLVSPTKKVISHSSGIDAEERKKKRNEFRY